jgi:hypothetical protein
MQQDLLSADELLGNIDSFTVEQRTARETFIEQELHLPREWLCEDGCGVDASPAGRVADAASVIGALAISLGQRRWCGLIMLAWPGPPFAFRGF